MLAFARHRGAVMKKLGIAVAAIALIGTPALAADLPLKALPPPASIYSWTGWYVGGSAGYGWAEPTDVIPVGTGTLVDPQFGIQLAAQLAGIDNPVHLKPKGPLGGLQFGYNWQLQGVVLGFEADYSWADIKGSGMLSTAVGVPGPRNIVTTTNSFASDDLKSIGTVRGRLGITPLPTLLLYGTGGFAFGEASSSTAMNFVHTIGFNIPGTPFSPIAASASQTLTGWTAGLGAEWAFAPHWSLKAEALYYDLGNLNYLVGTSTNAALSSSATVSASTHFYGNIARVGINYQFGGPVVARY